MPSPFVDAPLPDTLNHHTRQQTKLFSGIDQSRGLHVLLNPKRRSRRSQLTAAHTFTLPYRTITMIHPNDKPTMTRRYVTKQHGNQKKKNSNRNNQFNQPQKMSEQNKINKINQNNQLSNNTDQVRPPQTSSALFSSVMGEPQISEPGISERRGIKWVSRNAFDHGQALTPLQLPGHLKEPTSTLVLTSSRKQFVDIRIVCEAGHPLPNEGGPSELLDWGIAGESSSNFINEPSLDHPSNPPPPTDGSSRTICHTTFSHWIDSRTDTPGPDQGDMYPQSENITLELGAMYNPLTKSEQAYEELWADHPASPVDGQRWSIVIDLDDPEHKAKGRVVRVGEHCQAILKVGDQVTVERWKFEISEKEGKGAWKRFARLGDMFLPVSLTFTPERLVEGNNLTYGDYKWEVKEVYSW